MNQQQGYPALTHSEWHVIMRGNTEGLPPDEDFDLFNGELKNGGENTGLIPLITPPLPSPTPSPLPSPPSLIDDKEEDEEEHDEIVTLRDDVDVLAGRGGGANNNPGNKKYWKKVLVLRPKYIAAGRRDYTTKNRIANQLLMDVRKRGGRFLERDTATRVLSVITEDRALEKCKQALRDRHVPQNRD